MLENQKSKLENKSSAKLSDKASSNRKITSNTNENLHEANTNKVAEHIKSVDVIGLNDTKNVDKTDKTDKGNKANNADKTDKSKETNKNTPANNRNRKYDAPELGNAHSSSKNGKRKNATANYKKHNNLDTSFKSEQNLYDNSNKETHQNEWAEIGSQNSAHNQDFNTDTTTNSKKDVSSNNENSRSDNNFKLKKQSIDVRSVDKVLSTYNDVKKPVINAYQKEKVSSYSGKESLKSSSTKEKLSNSVKKEKFSSLNKNAKLSSSAEKEMLPNSDDSKLNSSTKTQADRIKLYNKHGYKNSSKAQTESKAMKNSATLVDGDNVTSRNTGELSNNTSLKAYEEVRKAPDYKDNFNDIKENVLIDKSREKLKKKEEILNKAETRLEKAEREYLKSEERRNQLKKLARLKGFEQYYSRKNSNAETSDSKLQNSSTNDNLSEVSTQILSENSSNNLNTNKDANYSPLVEKNSNKENMSFSDERDLQDKTSIKDKCTSVENSKNTTQSSNKTENSHFSSKDKLNTKYKATNKNGKKSSNKNVLQTQGKVLSYYKDYILNSTWKMHNKTTTDEDIGSETSILGNRVRRKAVRTTIKTTKAIYKNIKEKPYNNLKKADEQMQKAKSSYEYEKIKLMQKEAKQSAKDIAKKKSLKDMQKRSMKKGFSQRFREMQNMAKQGATTIKTTAIALKNTVQKSLELLLKNPKVIIAIVIVFLVLGGVFMVLPLFTGGTTVVGSSYTSIDTDLLEVDNKYIELENALRVEINNIETTQTGYDEYQYYLSEISHNPHELASYLSVKYGAYTLSDVESELERLFNLQYQLTQEELTGIDDEGNATSILKTTLNVKSITSIAEDEFTEEEFDLFNMYLATSGNNPLLFDDYLYSQNASGQYTNYAIPPHYLNDSDFRALIEEAEKYLGYPYVWGGSSPSTSFDCSGYVCWVLRESGVMDISRTSAQGIFNSTVPIAPSEATAGDLVFFTGTYSTTNAVTHVGIYVGDGVMIHCGSPISYADITTSYWSSHFYCYTRIN